MKTKQETEDALMEEHFDLSMDLAYKYREMMDLKKHIFDLEKESAALHVKLITIDAALESLEPKLKVLT